jgi:hypothetical protein
MGLATSWNVDPRPEWLDALRRSLRRSIAEQWPDGSWGYQPQAERHGAHPGAADLSVYYHGRCLAFLLHVLQRVPAVDSQGEVAEALERGLAFLTTVITPDGLKPLSLEGKRWFWDGSYEAGSNAYDVYALLRGAERFGRAEWAALATKVWRPLAAHQRPDGSILACLEPNAHDFVCPDFHTADLAWPAQVLSQLIGPSEEKATQLYRLQSLSARAGDLDLAVATGEDGPRAVLREDVGRGSGVIRLDGPRRMALIRTGKLPANTQFGGATGGGSLAAAVTVDGQQLLTVAREVAVVEAAFTAYPKAASARPLAGLRRFLANNPLGREGKQWLFVARVLAREGRLRAALSRLWGGYGRYAWWALRDCVSSRWALEADASESAGWLQFRSQLARPDGSVPGWAQDIWVAHAYRVDPSGLMVSQTLDATGGPAKRSCAAKVMYRLPCGAREVKLEIAGAHQRLQADGRLIIILPEAARFHVRIAYLL